MYTTLNEAKKADEKSVVEELSAGPVTTSSSGLSALLDYETGSAARRALMSSLDVDHTMALLAKPDRLTFELDKLNPTLFSQLESLSKLDQDVRLNPFKYQCFELGLYSSPATQANINAHTYRAIEDGEVASKFLAWKRITGIRYFDINNVEHLTQFVLLSGEERAIRALPLRTVKQVLPGLASKIIEYNQSNRFVASGLKLLNSSVNSLLLKVGLDFAAELTPTDPLLPKGLVTGDGEYYSWLVKNPEGVALFEKYQEAFSEEAQRKWSEERSVFLHQLEKSTPVSAAVLAVDPAPAMASDFRESLAVVEGERGEESPRASGDTVTPDTAIALIDKVALDIQRKFKTDGTVSELYREYLEQRDRVPVTEISSHQENLMNYLRKVDQHCKSEEVIGAWITCADKVSGFSEQVAILSKDATLSRVAVGISSVTQAISSVREVRNGLKLLSSGLDSAQFGMGVADLFGGIGCFIGAINIVSSLFGSKASRVDYSAMTYALVDALRQEMQQNFQIMQENFSTTWKKLDLMDEANQYRFQQICRSLAHNFEQVYRRLDTLSAKMQDRFSHVDWQLSRFSRQFKNEVLVRELSRILHDANDLLSHVNAAEEFSAFSGLIAEFNPPLSDVLSGKLLAAEADDFAMQVKSISHPLFALTTLSSFLNSQVNSRTSLYSRSQMQRVVDSIVRSSPDVIIAPVCGIEFFLPTVEDDHIASLGSALEQLKPGEVFVAPVDISGSWVMLYARQGDSPEIGLCGFDSALAQCQRLLTGILPSYFTIQQRTYPEDLSPFHAGVYCAELIKAMSENPTQSAESLIRVPFSVESVIAYEVQAGEPVPAEQIMGNPCIQLWLSLTLQKAITLYLDHDPTTSRILTSEQISKIIGLISLGSRQASLIVRAAHPELYRKLGEAYQEALREFGGAYAEWKHKTEERLLLLQRDAIRAATEASFTQSGVNVTRSEAWCSRVPIHDDYSVDSSSLAELRGWWNNHDYVRPDGNWRSPYNHRKQEPDGDKRRSYRENLEKQIRDAAIRTTEGMDGAKIGLMENLFAVDVYGHTRIGRSSLANLALIPVVSGQPLLQIPPQFINLLSEPMKQAYHLGLIEIRFTYELKNLALALTDASSTAASSSADVAANCFILRAEWRKKTTIDAEPWQSFSERHYDYNPLFYRENEAIWWYWQGGVIPIKRDALVVEYLLRSVNHYIPIAVPKKEERIGAITQNVLTLAEHIPAETLAMINEQVGALIRDWQRGIERQAAILLEREISDSTSALATALGKMDRYHHLLLNYLRLIEFGLQEPDRYKLILDELASKLHTSSAMLDYLKKVASMSSFEALIPETRTFAAIIENLCSMRVKLPDLFNPIQSPWIVLLNELRSRLRSVKQGLVADRLGVLSAETSYLEGQIYAEIHASGDTTFSKSLIAELKALGEQRAALVAKMQEKQEADFATYKKCQTELTQLSAKHQELRELVQKVQTFVVQGIVDETALTHLSVFDTKLTEHFRLLAEQLQRYAQAFDLPLEVSLQMSLEREPIADFHHDFSRPIDALLAEQLGASHIIDVEGDGIRTGESHYRPFFVPDSRVSAFEAEETVRTSALLFHDAAVRQEAGGVSANPIGAEASPVTSVMDKMT